MPGSVASAAPSTVMPWRLCKAFTHDREFAVEENEYRNGESQRGRLSDTSRKRWRLAQRLTPAELDELRDHFEARHGMLEPFYVYDVWETDPKFSYDETGVSVTGRYTVRYDSPWQQAVGMGRTDVDFGFREIA